MAYAVARLEELRKAINSVRPDKPELVASFSAEEFQILLEAGFGSADDFGDAGAETLRELGLDEARVNDLIPGGSESAATLLLTLQLRLPPVFSFRHEAGVLLFQGRLPVLGSWPSDLGSLGRLLRAPLPDAEFIGLPNFRPYHGKHFETHPTKVEEWPGWEEEVKARLQNGTQARLVPSHTSNYLTARLLCLEIWQPRELRRQRLHSAGACRLVLWVPAP